MEINNIIKQLRPSLTHYQKVWLETLLKSNTLIGPKDLEKQLIENFIFYKDDNRIMHLQDLIRREMRSQIFRDSISLSGFYSQDDFDVLMASGMSEDDALIKLLKPETQPTISKNYIPGMSEDDALIKLLKPETQPTKNYIPINFWFPNFNYSPCLTDNINSFGKRIEVSSLQDKIEEGELSRGLTQATELLSSD